MMFVLDTSITMAWCFESQSDAYCKTILRSLDEHQAIAPQLWILEVVNILIVAERRNRFLPAQSLEFLESLWRLPIEVESNSSKPVLSRELILLARANGLTSYDAAYLELANRKSLPLATRDSDLRRAANRCGVPLFLSSTDQH
jgi:predicted nucleic acid-binding protein